MPVSFLFIVKEQQLLEKVYCINTLHFGKLLVYFTCEIQSGAIKLCSSRGSVEKDGCLSDWTIK